MSKNKRVSISEKELHQLLFWSHCGTLYSFGGSYQKSIPSIIVKYAKKLNLKPDDFCMFNDPPQNKLAVDVLEEWNKQATKESRGNPNA